MSSASYPTSSLLIYTIAKQRPRRGPDQAINISKKKLNRKKNVVGECPSVVSHNSDNATLNKSGDAERCAQTADKRRCQEKYEKGREDTNREEKRKDQS
jgi:hypothetical protein